MIILILIGLVLVFFSIWVLIYSFIEAGLSTIFPVTKPRSTAYFSMMQDGVHVPPVFREGWIAVNGISSHVLTWGGWVEDPLPGDSVMIFMCGVPGITLFYQNFLEALYSQLRIPVWTICIAGHELPPASINIELPKDSNLYNSVEAQIIHKREFVKKFVPENCAIYFIGHSFGAKMVIELLKDEQIRCRTQKCFLLMPTIERFSETPRAKYWLKCTNSGLIYTIVLLSWILYCLPVWTRRVFSYLYFHSRGLHNVHKCCVQAMVEFCNPTVFYNVRCLVWDEQQAIRHLDIEVLSDLSDRIKVFFAPQDNWAPLTHCDTLKSAVPELMVEVLDDKFEHAFTLATAEDMAEIIVKDLETEIPPSLKNLDKHKKEQSMNDFTEFEQSISDLRSEKPQFFKNMCEYIQ